MKHATSRRLHAYWDRLRGAAAAPRRDQIEPQAIRDILADTLIVEVPKDGRPKFRLAGTGLCAAYGRELKGQEFLSLWSESDRLAIKRGIAESIAKTAPLLFEFTATTERGYDLAMEGILLPLFQSVAPADRLIGTMAAFTHPYWLGTLPLVRQRLGSVHVLYADQPAKLIRRRTDIPTFIPPAPLPQRQVPLAPHSASPRPQPAGVESGRREETRLQPRLGTVPSRRPALTLLDGGKR